MYTRCLFIAFSGLLLLTACHRPASNQKGDTTGTEAVVNTRPHGTLQIAPVIDLGDFSDSEIKKTATVSFSNIGNDTLYIIGAQPDCSCTEVAVIDSVVAPYGNGRLSVSLDLSDYPRDTIYKEVGIISSDPAKQVRRFQVRGVRH